MFTTINGITYNNLEFSAYRLLSTTTHPYGVEIQYQGGTKIIKDFDNVADRNTFIETIGNTYVQINSVYYNVMFFSAYYEENVILDIPYYNLVIHYGKGGASTKLIAKFESIGERTDFIATIQAMNSGGGEGGTTIINQANWGSVGGTITNQLDLMNILNDKLESPDSDGKLYLMQNGQWVELNISSTSGESAYEIAVRVTGFSGTEAEWVASLKGEDGVAGSDGQSGTDGKDFTYDMFTAEQLASLKGEDGKDGVDGTSFTFDDLTDAQKAELKGADGTPGVDGKDFTYDMFTDEQLAALKGTDGTDGTSFTFEDLTDEQKAEIKGEDGADGEDGKDFTYDMFTSEQLESLKGADGKDGKDGESGTSFTINSHVESESDLPEAKEEYVGIAFSVGTEEPYDIYICEYIIAESKWSWVNHGALQGAKGNDGETGETGETGADGFSPIVTVKTNTDDEYILEIQTDEDGTVITTPNLKGEPGEGGSGGSNVGFNITSELDGVKDTINIDASIESTNTISLFYGGLYLVEGIDYTIDFENHTITTKEVLDNLESRQLVLLVGEMTVDQLGDIKGEKGNDGFSPTITVNTSTSSEYTLDITNADGTITTPNLKGTGSSGTNVLYNLTSQLDGVTTTISIDDSITSENAFSLFYGGLFMVNGVDYTIDYDNHEITTVNGLDNLENRQLILVVGDITSSSSTEYNRIKIVDAISFNGTDTSYSIDNRIVNNSNIYINGLLLDITEDYTLVGNTITFMEIWDSADRCTIEI